MNSKPLTYPAMASTIKYLDANSRFQLNARNPSLENVEKSQPLVIDKLILDRITISINGIQYKLGTENKLDEDPKTLAIRQLEGRRQLINVKLLKIEGEGQILELLGLLPQCFKRFKVKIFSNWSMDLLHINQLIDPRIIPLNAIAVNDDLSLDLLDQIHRQEVLRTAVFLRIQFVPRELFQTLATLPNSYVDATIESVEVYEFLSLIDTLSKQDFEVPSRCFRTDDADLVKKVYKLLSLLAEGIETVYYFVEDEEDGSEVEVDEFPNVIELWYDGSTAFRAGAEHNEDNISITIEIFNRAEKNIFELFMDYF